MHFKSLTQVAWACYQPMDCMILKWKGYCNTPYWVEQDNCIRVQVYCRNNTHRINCKAATTMLFLVLSLNVLLVTGVEVDTGLTICNSRNMETYLPEQCPPNQLVLTNYRRMNSTAFRDTKTGHKINAGNSFSKAHWQFPARTIAELYICSQDVFLINEDADSTKINECLCVEKDFKFEDIMYFALAVLPFLIFGIFAYRTLKNWKIN